MRSGSILGIATWDTPVVEPRRQSPRLLKWLECLFLAGGAAALMWCAYVIVTAYVVQRYARETLYSRPMPVASDAIRIEPMESSALPAEEPSPLPSSSRPAPASFIGVPLAELSIPRVGVSAIVLEGSDQHTLRLGLGHIKTTPLPGEEGNVVITGHRDSFFWPLRNVQVGDDIWVNTFDAHVHYRVSWFRVVSPSEVSVLAPTPDAMLTLVTCFPFWFIGPAPERFVVRAMRVDDRIAEF